MDYLVFQLQGAMASWGEAAVGEYRGSHDIPTASALAGMIAAALGLRRDQEADLQALQASCLFGVSVRSAGSLLRDYQTAQVPTRTSMKGRRHVTRRDELGVPRSGLGTILSTRDYRQGVDLLVAVQLRPGSPYALETLQQALLRPTFVLYLGRKSCPPSAPLNPCQVTAESVLEAFQAYLPERVATAAPALLKMAWPEGMAGGVPADLTVTRKDRLLHRGAWQFGDRTEHIALLTPQEP